MTCSLDLGDLLDRARIEHDGPVLVLRFAYPCSRTGHPVERRLRRPVVFATATGALRLRGFDLARDAPRSFALDRIQPTTLTTTKRSDS
jgi:predicted DNA-binding transcriptional regulator YafY